MEVMTAGGISSTRTEICSSCNTASPKAYPSGSSIRPAAVYSPGVVWSMAEKIPCDRKCFLPDFFTCCYSGANGLILKGQLINFLQVIIRRCGSKGQGEIWQGAQFAFILYFRDKDEGYFFRCFRCFRVPLSSVPSKPRLYIPGRISVLSSALAGVAVSSGKCRDTAGEAEEAGQTATQNTPVYLFHSHTIPPIPEKTY